MGYDKSLAFKNVGEQQHDAVVYDAVHYSQGRKLLHFILPKDSIKELKIKVKRFLAELSDFTKRTIDAGRNKKC